MLMGFVSLVAAYLIGGIPFGLILVRLTTGEDVRVHGSGNIGATNVMRTAGRGAGIATLLLDGFKGWFAVWLASHLTGGSVLWMSFAALAVLCGPPCVFLSFLGSKAERRSASFVGAFAYLPHPLPLLAVILIFVFLTTTTRYLSLGSVAAAGLFPLACWMILHPDWPVLVASIGAAVLIIERHRGNASRGFARGKNRSSPLGQQRVNEEAGDYRRRAHGEPRSLVSSRRSSRSTAASGFTNHDLAERLESTRVNDPISFTGVTLPESVRASHALEPVLAGADVVLSVTPSHVLRATYTAMAPPARTSARVLVSASKGLEQGTQSAEPAKVICEVTGEPASQSSRFPGPTFAMDVATGSPTAVVAASEDGDRRAPDTGGVLRPRLPRLWQLRSRLASKWAALSKTSSPSGTGISDGLGLGHNAIAALITRGLAEINRLAIAMGARAETLAGLAGLGDLVLTCTGNLSRNRQLGIKLAAGHRLEDVLSSTLTVAEGVKTTSVAMELARRHGVELPIASEMEAVPSLGEGAPRRRSGG